MKQNMRFVLPFKIYHIIHLKIRNLPTLGCFSEFAKICWNFPIFAKKNTCSVPSFKIDHMIYLTSQTTLCFSFISSANQPFWYDLLRPNAILPPNRALRVHGLRFSKRSVPQFHRISSKIVHLRRKWLIWNSVRSRWNAWSRVYASKMADLNLGSEAWKI